MKTFRNPALLMAITISAIVAMYFGLVAGRAIVLLRTDDPAGRGLGAALLVPPIIGAWWLVHEWRLGIVVQRMETALEAEGRLPVVDGDTLPSGRLTDEAAEALFETARREVDERPDDWAAWFHLAHAYEANHDRKMARAAQRHAADLFRSSR